MNDLIALPQNSGAISEVLKSGEATSVMASIAIAKRFPRDETSAYNRIMTACKRPSLAEASQYEYTRGDTKVTGPSITLAKCIASTWGNIEFGWREVERSTVGDKKVSVIEAFAWDKESNTRNALTCNVAHWRDTKRGGYALTDERDIYEICANQAARRMRSCILSVVPGDVVESAVLECDKTLAGQNKEPISDRVRRMVQTFQEASVTQEMLETYLGHKLDACTETSLVRLRKVFTALRDGTGNVEDYFKPKQFATEEVIVATEQPKVGSAPQEQPKEAPKQEAPKVTPQKELESLVIGGGFSFSHLQSYGMESGVVPGADSMAGFEDVPSDVARRLIRAKTGLLAALTNIKGA